MQWSTDTTISLFVLKTSREKFSNQYQYLSLYSDKDRAPSFSCVLLTMRTNLSYFTKWNIEGNAKLYYKAAFFLP